MNGHIIPLNQTSIVKSLHWPDEQACQAYALSLSANVQLRHAHLCLHGDLGSGKTSFTRHLLQALGVSGRIKSPTYAVVESYELERDGKPLSIWHFDFYRFKDPQEWEDAGFRDVFATPGLKLCEWPQNAGPALPAPDVAMHIQWTGDTSRAVNWRALSARGEALLA